MRVCQEVGKREQEQGCFALEEVPVSPWLHNAVAAGCGFLGGVKRVLSEDVTCPLIQVPLHSPTGFSSWLLVMCKPNRLLELPVSNASSVLSSSPSYQKPQLV